MCAPTLGSSVCQCASPPNYGVPGVSPPIWASPVSPTLGSPVCQCIPSLNYGGPQWVCVPLQYGGPQGGLSPHWGSPTCPPHPGGPYHPPLKPLVSPPSPKPRGTAVSPASGGLLQRGQGQGHVGCQRHMMSLSPCSVLVPAVASSQSHLGDAAAPRDVPVQCPHPCVMSLSLLHQGCLHHAASRAAAAP